MFFSSRRIASAVAFTICLALALALAAACGGSGSPGPAGTPESTPTPPLVREPPPDVPVDLDLADRLAYEGEYEEAMDIYSAVVLRGPEGQQERALWSLGRLHFQLGEYMPAGQVLEAFLELEPPDEQARRALLLQGAAGMARGDSRSAEEAFSRYLEADGPAAAVALLRLGELAARQGRQQEAVERTEEAIAAGLSSSETTRARFAIAGYHESANDLDTALEVYDALAEEAPFFNDRAEALWQAARVAQHLDDTGTAEARLNALVAGYASHRRALAALDHPLLTAPLADRALVLFRHRSNEEAAEAYRALLAGGEGVAEAHYRLGILAERASDPATALEHYDASVAAATAAGDMDALARALWDRGLVLEWLGRPDDAAATYAALADRIPGADRAADAAFRSGLLFFLQGRPGEAAVAWEAHRVGLTDDSPGRLDFWAGRAYDAIGDPDVAAGYFLSAIEEAPLSYYGLRARAFLGDAAPPDPTEVEPRPPNWAEAETYLRSLYGPEDQEARADLFGSPAWQRGVELLHAGLVPEADAEFRDLVAEVELDGWLLYRLARALRDEGRIPMSSRAGGLLLHYHPSAPPAIAALAYPIEFARPADAAASEYGISPWLLLGLVRQESLYDPGAVSPAEAMGLTQVIPPTADEIASALRETDFEQSDLFRPHVSLRFGAFYLAAQVERFGSVPPALAAYNGGPGNAARWLEMAGGDDPDVFMEIIDFAETRSYVQLVLENYARYLYAYGLTDEPSLPL